MMPPRTEESLRVDRASGAIRDKLGGLRPEVGVILGSGLGALADAVVDPVIVPYRDVPGFPQATVAGHRGELVAGALEGRTVLLQRGRLHLYEGHTAAAVVLPVRVMAVLGIRTLIVTNAAGGLRETFVPPVLMAITDHLNLTGHSALAGPVLEGEERFPDMSVAYDLGLRALAGEVAQTAGLVLEEGIYAGLAGPAFETPAEIHMLQGLGADAVGMSTVQEVMVARARGMRVLGISTITNLAAGLAAGPLSHREVLDAGAALARDLERLVRGVLRGL